MFMDFSKNNAFRLLFFLPSLTHLLAIIISLHIVSNFAPLSIDGAHFLPIDDSEQNQRSIDSQKDSQISLKSIHEITGDTIRHQNQDSYSYFSNTLSMAKFSTQLPLKSTYFEMKCQTGRGKPVLKSVSKRQSFSNN